MGGPGLKMNFPIKNWDIPAIAMLVYQSVAIPGCLNHNKHHQNLPSSRDVRTARRRVVRQNQSICQVHGFQPTPRNVAPFKIWTNNKVLYIGYPGTINGCFWQQRVVYKWKKVVYTANWGIICYLPPFRGTRNNH